MTQPRLRVRQAVIDRDTHINGGACWACGTTTPPFHVDHIIPRSFHVENEAWNLWTLCRRCNIRKSATHPIDWIIKQPNHEECWDDGGLAAVDCVTCRRILKAIVTFNHYATAGREAQ